MSYGTPDWEGWVLDEATSLEHIKFAYESGINTFDTANVRFPLRVIERVA
jgi:aryl-alcohol dehydrogenase-like predicted oxidoreductase